MQPLHYEIKGNSAGTTLVFLHGWPDDASLWDKQLPAFQDDHRCVLVTLPNFGLEHDVSGGLNWRELLARFERTIREVAPGESVVLIGHDWGAYLSYLFERDHPEQVERLVVMDVAGHLSPTPVAFFLIFSYQWALISSWLAGGVYAPLGNALTRISARIMGVPARRIPHIKSKCNYVYFYLWKAVLFPFFGAQKVRLPFFGPLNAFISPYKPTAPVLFLYGQKKPFPLHSSHWLKLIEEAGGQCKAYPKGDHWFMLSHSDDVNATICTWLKQ